MLDLQIVESMPTQAQLIDKIIEERGRKAEDVNKRIEHLTSLLTKLSDYDSFRSRIIDDDGRLIENSPFANIFRRNPDMLFAVKDADSAELSEAIRKHLEVLKRLKTRFERKTISIQVFGRAGNGKSKFIQSVSGLTDDTVLTSGADHTTGATSYIQNASEFKARIYTYTKDEVLEIFNHNLATVSKYFEIPALSISTFSEIRNFDFHSHGIEVGSHRDVIASVMIYVQNYDSILETINYTEQNGQLDADCGRKFIEKNVPSEVQQYVAHHNGLPEGQGRVEYSKFLAVKYVRLYNPFNCGDAAKIELMDTVGLGNPETNDQVMENMYDAIEENSDMVVQIYCPSAGGSWRGDFQSQVMCMESIHYKDSRNRIERIPNDALFFILNKKICETSDNTRADLNNGIPEGGAIKLAHKEWDKFNFPETVLEANCADANDVRENVMIPILKRMTECLKSIDEKKASLANMESKNLYNMYRNFLSRMNAVLLVGAEGNVDLYLHKWFQDIFDADLHSSLKNILIEARENMPRPGAALQSELHGLCNVETANNIVQNDEKLNNIILEGIRLNHSYHKIYDDAAGYMRLSIPNRFRSIDTNLQEQIAKKKAAVFECLYKVGRLSSVLAYCGDDSLSDVELAIEWARKFVTDILDERNYPVLTRLFNNLLNFNINVEGFLLYRIVKHLDIYDTNYIGQIPPDKIERGVRHHIKINTAMVYTKISDELREFVQAPNEAVYFAVEEFFYSLMFDGDSREEVFKLYSTYKRSIWEEELQNIGQQTIAFNEWQAVRNSIREFDKSAKF